MNWKWLPWIRERQPNGHAAQAVQDSLHKLEETKVTQSRVEDLTDRLAARNRENQFRLKMEAALRGQHR